MAEKTEKKMKALDKARASPSAKLNDQASSKIDKLKSKTDKLNNTRAKVKLEAKDDATNIITKAQNKINGWIKTGAKKIISIGLAGTIALGGIGIGSSVKTFTSFEKGLSNVKAVTGATNAEMKVLKNTAKDLGASTEWSAVQVTEAEELLGQAGFKVGETTSALPGLLSLASAGSLDLATATDIASGTLRAFNIDASQTSHVADVLALSAAATNSDVTDLGQTMKYAAPVSQALGISFEDTAAAAGLLSNANIKGSQAGTILRQAMARLASPTDDAAGFMEEYGINAFDAQGNMKSLSKVVDNLNSSLGGLTSQKRADVISTIFGTESMSGILALMNQGGQNLGDLSQKLKDANGASKEMADTKLDNLAGQWTILKSAVEGMNIELGERLAPYAKQFVTWFTGKIPGITDKIVSTVDYISKHTDTIKSIALTIAGLGVSFSALSAVGSIGNTISGVSKLAKVLKGGAIAGEATKIAGGIGEIGVAGKLLPGIFSPVGAAVIGTVGAIGIAVKANNDLMKKSITTTVEELGPVQKIMNKFHGNIFKSEKEMKKLGLIYDDFGEGVSKTFKDSAKEASKSILELQMNLNSLTYDGKVNEKEAESFNKWIGDFTTGAIDAINEKRSEIKSAFEKTFNLDGVISGSEQGSLDCLDEFFDSGVKKEIEIRDQIYKIGSESIKNHGTIIDEDMEIIKSKIAEVKAIQLEYTKANNAYEKAYAQNQFKRDSNKVTGVDGASELLKGRAEDHKSKLNEIDDNYNGTIAYYKSLLSSSNLNDNQRKNWENGLKEAEKVRDEALKQARESWESDLETVYQSYPKAKGMINEFTGDKLSGKDINSQKTMDKMKETYAGIEQITKSGNYIIYDSTSKAWKSLEVSIDEESGKLVGLYDATSKKCGGYTADMASEVKNLGNAHSEANKTTADGMNFLTGATINAKGQIVSASNEVIASLENTQITTEGLHTGILNLNGTEIQIRSDNSGAILNMDQVMTAIGQMPNEKNIIIDSNCKEVKDDVGNLHRSINNVPESKTITFFKKVITTVEEVFGNSANEREEKHNEFIKGQRGAGSRRGYANGTNSSIAGLATVDERGWELSDRKTVPIIGSHNGNPLTHMSKGTKILNHMQSVNDMKREVARQIDNRISYKQPQVQYQVAQASQPQVEGFAGLNFGDINVNLENNENIDAIVAEATKEVARKLKEALTNIKK